MAKVSEHLLALEVKYSGFVHGMCFTPDDEHIIGHGPGGVRVWQVKDGNLTATMNVEHAVDCVAVSGDGKWIAGGTWRGEVIVWDTGTYKRVFADSKISGSTEPVFDLNFSPTNPRRFVAADVGCTATVWDSGLHQKVLTLNHPGQSGIYAAKYSPQGDRIATGTDKSLRIWDSNDGRVLLEVNIDVYWYIEWRYDHLFIWTKNDTAKQIDAATGSIIWECPVRYGTWSLPQDGQFIAFAGSLDIAFWDTATHTQFSSIGLRYPLNRIACSSNGQLLALLDYGKISVRKLRSVIPEPELDLDNAALDAWKHGQLADADKLLSAAIPKSKDTAHHVLASRALVRAHLERWDEAFVDAEESINIQRSLIGYVAKSVALVGKGEKERGLQICDMAFHHFHSEYATLLLVIKAVVLFMAGEHANAISRMNDLITDCAHGWVYPALYVIQAYMTLLVGSKHMDNGDYERAIQSFKDARIKLGNRARQTLLIVSLISGWKSDGIATKISQHLCEALFAADHAKEAAESVLLLTDQEINVSEPIKTWVSDFKYRCRRKLEDLGDGAANAEQYDEAVSNYTAALSLAHASPQDLLMKRSNVWVCKDAREDALNDARAWARLMLGSGLWKNALASAVGFTLGKFAVYQALCEHLETTGHITEGAACFHQMSIELAQEIDEEQGNWTHDFKSRCCKKLEDLGDSALNVKQYDEAVSQYTAALSLHPAGPQALLAKRSKACSEKGDWEDALSDANEVVKLDPSSPSGYERRYTALLGIGHQDDAIDAFESMLSKMSESLDPEIRERSCCYVRPEHAKEAIRISIQDAIRDSPKVLINALSGRLCDKLEQAAAFESTPDFTTLVVSMTTRIDHARIEQVVGEFYRYATLSHTWEGSEPLYEKVIKIVVYNLEASPTHGKLQTFCKIVRDEGFNWAWSDTCCIDKGDHFILQEALVSMFKWYEGSALTIIYLCDIDRLAELGALTMSRWNSRGWTFQEYHASKVVRIYTKDWTPYLGLTMRNHKESPQIISEMENATGISAPALMALRPGLSDIREKLRLVSTRHTTRVEDAAYSLLGIFSMTLPVTYGEGDKALGRFLSQLLMSSGDTSILAWSGRSGSFNSCLPINIVVYSQPLTSHIPPALPEAEMESTTARLHASAPDRELVTRLYNRVDELPTPTFAGQRMRLPCLSFKIKTISPFQDGSEMIYRAQAGALGVVQIRSRQKLARLDSLLLIHPWIDFLLDRHAGGSVAETTPDEDDLSDSDEIPSFDSIPNLSSTSEVDLLDDEESLPSPTFPPLDVQMKFLARLRRPFGALLLVPAGRNAAEYKRISSESSITVEVQDLTVATLNRLIRGVRVLDVL